MKGHVFTKPLANAIKAFKPRCMQYAESYEFDQATATMIKRVVAAYERGPA